MKGEFTYTDKPIYCKHCKHTVDAKIRSNGPHTEAACSICGKHIKFLKKQKKQIMAQGFWGSICLNDIFGQFIAKDQQGNEWINLGAALQAGGALTKAQNGKIYISVNVWVNDQYDQYQNIASIQLGQSKEQRAAGQKKVYIGNLKYMDNQQRQAQPPQQQGYPQQQQQGYPQQGYPQQQPPQQQPPAGVPGMGMAAPNPQQFAPPQTGYQPQQPANNPWGGGIPADGNLPF